MTRSVIAMGVLLALGSATAFGVTLPVLGWAGVDVGAWTTASLLYAGASLASLALKPFVVESGAAFTRASVRPLLVMAIAGAAIAPTLLAWGLQRVGPVTGGLLLNLEVVWTVVLARLMFREFLGARVGVALVTMSLGGLVLGIARDGALGWNALGVAAIVVATLAWAIDNTASRTVAELRPLSVVAAKGALGALVTMSAAFIVGEPRPEAWRAVVLLLAGASGYGLSLRLYLLAQRRVGAARTASVFALAPFIGAALGLVVAPEQVSLSTAVAAALFAFGVLLHVKERHGHAHRHDAVSHDHVHRHDDDHHTHTHTPEFVGEHAHVHNHDPLDHTHEHADDVHHGHAH